jgi:hypothetical protein
MGGIAAVLAGIESPLTPRRAGGATFVTGAGIGVAILFAELLLVVISVMFFSH